MVTYNTNRPFWSCVLPLFQSETTCKTFDMKMSFICKWMKTQFRIKDFALTLKRAKVNLEMAYLIFNPSSTNQHLVFSCNVKAISNTYFRRENKGMDWSRKIKFLVHTHLVLTTTRRQNYSQLPQQDTLYITVVKRFWSGWLYVLE